MANINIMGEVLSEEFKTEDFIPGSDNIHILYDYNFTEIQNLDNDYCKIKKDAKSKGILPSAATIKNKTYPISRYLFMYLREKPTGETKKFIDWILSDEGQNVIVEVGYYPLK